MTDKSGGEQPQANSKEDGDGPQAGQAPSRSSSGFERLVKNVNPKALRTKLDAEAVRAMGKKLSSEKELRLREQIESRPQEPLKPFKAIEQYKMASACPSAWEQMKGTGQVRFCERCRLQVYDFSKVELPEAEDIIFKREDKRDVVLYRRKDGKFLTSDCPVGVQNKLHMVLAIAAAVLLAAGAITLVSLIPPPPPAPSSAPAEATSPAPDAGKPASTTGGDQVEQAGNPVPGQSQPEPMPAPVGGATEPYPWENQSSNSTAPTSDSSNTANLIQTSPPANTAPISAPQASTTPAAGIAPAGSQPSSLPSQAPGVQYFPPPVSTAQPNKAPSAGTKPAPTTTAPPATTTEPNPGEGAEGAQ